MCSRIGQASWLPVYANENGWGGSCYVYPTCPEPRQLVVPVIHKHGVEPRHLCKPQQELLAMFHIIPITLRSYQTKVSLIKVIEKRADCYIPCRTGKGAVTCCLPTYHSGKVSASTAVVLFPYRFKIPPPCYAMY